MKKLIIFCLFLFNNCATPPARIHNKSKYFIDIEVNNEDFYMECSEIDSRENKSLMSFYAIDGDKIHQFIFRSISEAKWCENKVKLSYIKLVKDMHRVRLVGISPNEQIEKNYLTNEAIPDKLKKPSSIINWTFIRLETTKGCKGYFNEDCKPENYWGGLFPQ